MSKEWKNTLGDVAELKIQQKAAEMPATKLPDLDKIEVPEVSGDTFEQIKKEVSERKQWAEAAGAKLQQIQEQIRKLERDSSLNLSPHGKEVLAQLKAAEKKLLNGFGGDEALKQHVEFSQLLEEIRATDPAHIGEVRSFMNRLVGIGRYKVATSQEIEEGKKAGKWPSGTIFFEGKIYFSTQEKSAGQRALEAELRKLVEAAKLSKAASIKTRGNADLSGFEAGMPGLYYFFSPKRTEGDRHFNEGHALIEIRDLNKGKADRKPYVVADVRDACGSLSWMVSRKKWIPLFWINKGRVITRPENRLEKEEFEYAIRFIRTVRALVLLWKEEHKPVENALVEALADFCVEKKSEVEPIETPPVISPVISAEEAASRVTAVHETDMTTVKVEKISKPKKEKAKKAE